MTAASTFTLTSLFGAPFYTGLIATSPEIPGRYPVALGGRGFLVDFESNEYVHQSIPLLRDQADQSATPGEGSVNPEDLWRRTATSWVRGGGQKYFDLPTSVSDRFHESKGVDPWTEGQISLLPESVQHTNMPSVNSNLCLTTAGSRLYSVDGGTVRHTSDVLTSPTTWTAVTFAAPPGSPATSITSDGYSVWTSHTAGGVYLTNTATNASTSAYTGTVAGCKYLKGRLFAWNGPSLYNLTVAPPAALPAAMLTHPNTQFSWVDLAEANGFYFAAGVSGDKSTIYFTGVKADGTGLEVPVVAAELPDGEIVRSIQGYLGFLLIGTDRGIRFGSPNDQGNVTLGGLIDDALEVRCFEGQGPFIWFGWSQYDAATSGLGRMDLASFNGTRPAYASDIMTAAGAGDVTAVVTFQDRRVYAVSGSGIFVEGTNRVSSGYFTTGSVTYGLSDVKVSMYLNVNHEPLAGSLAASLSRDHGDFASIGTGGTAGTSSSSFSTNQGRARVFDVKLTLTRDTDSPTLGPVVGSLTLRAYPAAIRSERVTIPLILGTNQRDLSGASVSRNVANDLTFLRSLESDGAMTTLQEASEVSSVVVEDHLWRPHHFEGSSTPAGTYLVQLKRFSEE